MNTKQTEALKLALDWYDNGKDDRAEFTCMVNKVIALAEQPAQVDPCIDGSCSCCWTHLDDQPAQQQEPVAWVWNPAKEAWEKVHAFGHWQQETIYAFGPTMPSPLTEPQQKEPMQEIARLHERIKDLENDVEFLSLSAQQQQQEPPCKTGGQCTSKCQQCEHPAQVDPCIDGSCSCCWTHLDEQPAQHPCDAPCGDIKCAVMCKQHEQPAQQQEPVAKVCHDLDGHIGWNPKLTQLPDEGTLLYTSPQPSKPWAGLTQKEIQEMKEEGIFLANCEAITEVIEAKLREKNT